MTDFELWIKLNCIYKEYNYYNYNGRIYKKYDLHDIFLNTQRI